VKFRGVINAILLFAGFVLLSVLPCLSQQRGPSTPEERARAVKAVRSLEVNPLSKEVLAERVWALRWLIGVPDISVKVCGKLPDLTALKKYKYDSDLFALVTLSQAAFIIENPDKAKDLAVTSLAGMESMLKAYETILKDNPKTKSKYLDDLLEKRNRGELAAYVKELATGCR